MEPSMCWLPRATRCMHSASSGSSRGVRVAGGFLVLITVGFWTMRGAHRDASVMTVRAMTLAEALPVLHALGDRVPEELSVSQLTEAAWSKWITRRSADIRSRLDKGDEDSVVNL